LTRVNEPISPDEMTLGELRSALAPLLPTHAAFDGWNEAALAVAAAEVGVPADRARLAFPDGPVQMIDAWFDSVDLAMARAYPLERIDKLKIRERIRDLVLFRIEQFTPHKEALRRALAIIAQPQNAMAGARLAWRAADRMWRIAGDRATDFNHYSKRGILSALYTSTMLVFLDDDSEGIVTTRGFLDRRIDDVMRIEKLKASWRGSGQRLPSLSRFLGRLRYPAV
jgi:ubiquinone biosynthesis protein COQ9